MLAAFGAGILPGRLGYEEWFGLYLNLNRVRLQNAYAVAKGIELMFGESVGPGVFAAISETDEEGRSAWMDTVLERQMSRAMNRGKGRK